MKYNISYEKKCLKYFKKLDKNTQIRILKAINEKSVVMAKSHAIGSIHDKSLNLDKSRFKDFEFLRKTTVIALLMLKVT